MKLRELIKATTNFNYEVIEYILDTTGNCTKQIKEIKCTTTQLRSKDFGLRHEKLIGNTWFILSKEEFQAQLNYTKSNKVIRRTKDGKANTTQINLTLADRCFITDHFKQRALERFNIPEAQLKGFLTGVFKGHYIIQNYNTFLEYGKHKYEADDLVVISKDCQVIFVATPKNGRFILKTCFKAGNRFSDWFQQSMDTLHLMPTLETFYKIAS